MNETYKSRPPLKQFLFSDFFRLVILTAGLFIGTLLITGSFYETNDDIILTFLLKGIFTGQPVTDLSLYLHGLSTLIYALNQFLPDWPWYGLILYSLLFIITLLAFRFIFYALKPILTAGSIYLVIILFYLVNWYEHIFWFSYSRLALLLAGVAALNSWLDSRPGQEPLTTKRLLGYGFCFFLALCLRPSMAWYGLGIVLPVLIFPFRFSRLVFRRTALLLAPFLVAGVLFSSWWYLKTTPAQNEYRRQDILKSQILDYNWCCPTPTVPTDKLLYAGINNWFLADNNILLFLKRNPPNWRYFWENAAFPKFMQLLRYLIFDHFTTLIFLIAFICWWIIFRRKKMILPLIGFNFYFWLLVFFTGILLKIPPRVLTPALSLLLLTHLLWWRDKDSKNQWSLLIKAFMLILLVVQLYKISHRLVWQQQRQKQSEAIIAQIKSSYPGYLLVAAGLENELRALSPFKNYDFGEHQILFLTGWPTLDPHYSEYLYALAGSATLAGAIDTLSHRKKVILLSNSGFASFLVTYFKNVHHQSLRITLTSRVKVPLAPNNLYFYQLEKCE